MKTGHILGPGILFWFWPQGQVGEEAETWDWFLKVNIFQYRWTYLQGRNRDADIENGLVDMGGKGRVGRIGRLGLTYIYTTMCKIDS